MKFYDCLLALLFFGIISISISSFLFDFKEIESQIDFKKKQVCSQKFIAETFRNTCKGNGFKNLQEWQITCRDMFGLDYIGWSKADEFMIDENAQNYSQLYYGKWTDCELECNGEVYCRSNMEE